MPRPSTISDCDRFSEKSISSCEIMPLSVSASEMSGSSSSCDIHYRPLPPIRKKRIRSMLVQNLKIDKQVNRATEFSVFVWLINTTNNDPPFIVHVARKKYNILNWKSMLTFVRYVCVASDECFVSFHSFSNPINWHCAKKIKILHSHTHNRNWNETWTNQMLGN